MYRLSQRRWKKWLEKLPEESRDQIGDPVSGVYSPKQVRAIFTIFDPPETDFS